MAPQNLIPGTRPFSKSPLGHWIDSDGRPLDQYGYVIPGMPVAGMPPGGLEPAPVGVGAAPTAGGTPYVPPPVPQPVREYGAAPLKRLPDNSLVDKYNRPCDEQGYLIPAGAVPPPIPPAVPPAMPVAPAAPQVLWGTPPFERNEIGILIDSQKRLCDDKGQVLPPEAAAAAVAAAAAAAVAAAKAVAAKAAPQAEARQQAPANGYGQAPIDPVITVMKEMNEITRTQTKEMLETVREQNRQMAQQQQQFMQSVEAKLNQQPQYTPKNTPIEDPLSIYKKVRDILRDEEPPRSPKAETGGGGHSDEPTPPKLFNVGGWNAVLKKLPDGTTDWTLSPWDTWAFNVEHMITHGKSLVGEVKKLASTPREELKAFNDEMERKLELDRQAEEREKQRKKEAEEAARQQVRDKEKTVEEDARRKASTRVNFTASRGGASASGAPGGVRPTVAPMGGVQPNVPPQRSSRMQSVLGNSPFAPPGQATTHFRPPAPQPAPQPQQRPQTAPAPQQQPRPPQPRPQPVPPAPAPAPAPAPPPSHVSHEPAPPPAQVQVDEPAHIPPSADEDPTIDVSPLSEPAPATVAPEATAEPESVFSEPDVSPSVRPSEPEPELDTQAEGIDPNGAPGGDPNDPNNDPDLVLRRMGFMGGGIR